MSDSASPERPAVSDHLRPTESGHPDGVYRVVGTGERTVTLLRVGDGEGRRVVTGEVRTVEAADLTGFEPAANPDGNRPLDEAARGKAEAVYWSLRVFVGELAANPLATGAAVSLVLLGSFGSSVIPFTETTAGALVMLGSLGLVYIGSGRR